MNLTSLALVFLGIMHKNLVKHATIPDIISALWSVKSINLSLINIIISDVVVN